MAASCFDLNYDGQDVDADMEDICSMMVKQHPEMKRGDFVHLTLDLTSDRYVIFNGQKLLPISDDDDLPAEFKVVTEFPIQYWHSDADVFLPTTAKVNFDYPLFRDMIKNHMIAADSMVYAAFSHKDKEYRLVFDGLQQLNDRTRQLAIQLLDEGKCYFSPHPIELELETFPDNYLYMIPKVSWD